MAGTPRSYPRIGLVGCGLWGHLVLRDLGTVGARVRVVARGDASRRRAEAGGATEIVGSTEDLGQVDGIVICTPTTTHAAVVEQLVSYGVPILVTKPLCDDVEAARHLVSDAGDRLFVMHIWRYHPGVVELARIARQGELGEVRGVHSRREVWGNRHADVDSVWMLAPHDISILLEILGSVPEPRAASVERTGGVITGLVGLLGGEPWATVEVSSARPVHRWEVVLICEWGVALLSEGSADLVQITRGTLQHNVTRVDEHRAIDRTMPLLLQLGAFVDHVCGGPPPRSSAADGMTELEAITRLRQLAGLGAVGVAGAR